MEPERDSRAVAIGDDDVEDEDEDEDEDEEEEEEEEDDDDDIVSESAEEQPNLDRSSEYESPELTDASNSPERSLR